MIKVNLKLINRDDKVVASGWYKEFKNIDELIMFCTSHSNWNYTCEYDLVEEDK